jgi:hypothetical protein
MACFVYVINKPREGCGGLRSNTKDVFVENFQGTYVRLGNPWDLKNYRRKPDKTLRHLYVTLGFEPWPLPLRARTSSQHYAYIFCVLYSIFNHNIDIFI